MRKFSHPATSLATVREIATPDAGADDPASGVVPKP